MSLLQKIAKLKGVELGTTSKLVPLIQLLRTRYPKLSEQNLNNLTIDCHRNPAILDHLGIKTTHSFPYEVFECRCFTDGEICASHDFVDCNLYVEDKP